MVSVSGAVTTVLLLVTVLCLTHKGHGAPKSVAEHKMKFGWPNFFKPEMSMVRDKKEGKGDKHEAEDNTLDNSLHEDEEYEALIDYTLKGGLRGTLLLLNSTSLPQGANLTTSEMKNLTETAKMVMEGDKKGGEEENEDGGKSDEIQTEEGLRLRTPIVTKKHPTELGKYGAKITFYSDEEKPTKFIYYGNWCGRGGRSAPVDPVDRCCLDHDMCYGRTVKQCPDVWRKPYDRMYAWTLLEKEVVCVRSESSCVNHICNCDRDAAVCFSKALQQAAASTNTTHIGTKAF